MVDRLPFRGVALGLLLVAFGLAGTSCGSATNPLPAELSVVDMAFVFPNDAPLDPTLEIIPRNTWIRIEFSKPVDAATLTRQTIRARWGATLTNEAFGTLRPDGNVVRFDPTIGADGSPNPFGFPRNVNASIEVRAFDEASSVVHSVDGDPVVLGMTKTFAISDEFLHESDPPSVLGVRFIPERDPTTGDVPSSSTLLVDFDEVMDFASLVPGRDTLEPHVTFDVRYTITALNNANGVAGRVIPGQTALSRDARSVEFRPVFGFGPRPFEFEVRVTSGMTDLAGNSLSNPQVLGQFRCDGESVDLGTVLTEDFRNVADRDLGPTDADWGLSENGVCTGNSLTSRDVFIVGSEFTDSNNLSGRGTYVASFEPLIGTDLDQLIPGLTPQAVLGRRIMYSFSDQEIGPGGTITALAWGPDSNATFLATYPLVTISAAHRGQAFQQLVPTFANNHNEPLTVLYSGVYAVPQRANIGNTPGLPRTPHQPGYGSAANAPCNGANNWNQPLFDWTGFQPWPQLVTFFDWDPGLPGPNDEGLVLDFDVRAGTTFQTIRSWFGDSMPCSGLILGFPQRRLRSVSGGTFANPITAAPVVNPEPSVHDMQITISRIKSLAQSRFYTPLTDLNQAAGGRTFGADSDYQDAIIPTDLMGNAKLEIEYQGATALDPLDLDGETPDLTQPITPWTADVNVCDGFPYIRWRLRLIGDLASGDVGAVPSVQIPVRDASFVK